MSWFALVLACAAVVAALAALTARSLFALCMHLAAFGALTAAALLSLGDSEAGLSAALVFAAWGPLLLLGGMLLSARAAKTLRKGAPWASLGAAALTCGVVLLALPELGPSAATASGDAPGAIGFWLAPLMLAVAAVCIGLLGFGERGALSGSELER